MRRIRTRFRSDPPAPAWGRRVSPSESHRAPGGGLCKRWSEGKPSEPGGGRPGKAGGTPATRTGTNQPASRAAALAQGKGKWSTSGRFGHASEDCLPSSQCIIRRGSTPWAVRWEPGCGRMGATRPPLGRRQILLATCVSQHHQERRGRSWPRVLHSLEVRSRLRPLTFFFDGETARRQGVHSQRQPTATTTEKTTSLEYPPYTAPSTRRNTPLQLV